MFCSEWTLVKWQGGTATPLPLKCKCWTCDLCRPDRKKRLVGEARLGKPTIFLTLTSRRLRGENPHEAARALVVAWRTIRKEFMKEKGKGSLPFIAVFEKTKAGWPHLHIVARTKWLSQKWLSKRMKELTDSPVCDVGAINDLKKTAYYITKYIGKNPKGFEGTKRYWRSLDYLTPREDEEDNHNCSVKIWEIVKEAWIIVASRHASEGTLSADGWQTIAQHHGVPP